MTGLHRSKIRIRSALLDSISWAILLIPRCPVWRMTFLKIERARALGRPVLGVLLGALLLAIIAWAIAGVYGVVIKSPSTEQRSQPPASFSPNPASNDPVQSKTDKVNVEPVDQNPKIDKSPTPQSSKGGDQEGRKPAAGIAEINIGRNTQPGRRPSFRAAMDLSRVLQVKDGM